LPVFVSACARLAASSDSCHPSANCSSSFVRLPMQGKSGNPNCLCNLLPAPGGFRRQGLWAKEADVLGTLGPDPAETKRQVLGGRSPRRCHCRICMAAALLHAALWGCPHFAALQPALAAVAAPHQALCSRCSAVHPRLPAFRPSRRTAASLWASRTWGTRAM
jgi:hypothetical protein